MFIPRLAVAALVGGLLSLGAPMVAGSWYWPWEVPDHPHYQTLQVPNDAVWANDLRVEVPHPPVTDTHPRHGDVLQR
jgi:hypothetical protein